MLEVKSKVLYIIKNNELVKEASIGDEIQLIFSKTPFYAESGGQVADTGFILSDNARIIVNNVIKAPNKQHLHNCTVFLGTINVGDEMTLKVNRFSRDLITRNHTATHLLHKALKIVLGDHINQSGSYVSSERLRFDFNHFEALSKEQLTEIEKIVNLRLLESLNVEYEEMPLEKAIELGAIALFAEKYSEIVRVVSIDNFSVELCGGCHVKNTSEIGIFKIISETGIGAGIRRIEAVTSEKAIEYTQSFIDSIDRISQILKTTPQDVIIKAEQLVSENKNLARAIDSLNQKIANNELNELIKNTQEINGYTVLQAVVNNIEISALRNMIDNFKAQLKSVIVVLANITDNKVIFMAGVTKDYVAQGIHAGKLVKRMAEICGGNGGGRPDFAQAGANNIDKVEISLKYISEYLK
jgi:alanyl-tRNA synthetase